MFLKFRKKYCPVCGNKGVKEGSCYKCANCETVFSDFGIVKEPFNGALDIRNMTDLMDIFEDN